MSRLVERKRSCFRQRSSGPNLAGMDGNRTHQRRLNSASRTVLKTAFLTSAGVRQGVSTIKPHLDGPLVSAKVRWHSEVWLSAWLSWDRHQPWGRYALGRLRPQH